ncbi:MAG TPA: peptidoglycan-binding domain-containing protein [Bryobacteraceae bacterium]|nr:peptidoglycan-binding domain-containing protein [Bryobacteraceae bacterium]
MAVRILRKGMYGEDVKAIQEGLNTWGADPPLVTDGAFGPKTDQAVREFQEEKGLVFDGIVGKQTRRTLFPVGVGTVTVCGMSLKMRDAPPVNDSGRPVCKGPGLDPAIREQIISHMRRPLFESIRLPGVRTPLMAPKAQELKLDIPPWMDWPPHRHIDLDFDHIELQPGTQHTFSFSGWSRDDLWALTWQNVFLLGRDDRAHQEVDYGLQWGFPFPDPHGRWGVNYFWQITDVDRFGKLGLFHWWQPYAQVGFQYDNFVGPKPSLTANLCPVNLSLDIKEWLTLNFAGCLACSLDLRNGKGTAGLQLAPAVTLKYGHEKKNR